MSTEDYVRTQHEVEIMTALAQGELENERDEGADFESVFAKADELFSWSE